MKLIDTKGFVSRYKGNKYFPEYIPIYDLSNDDDNYVKSLSNVWGLVISTKNSTGPYTFANSNPIRLIKIKVKSDIKKI